MGDVVNLNRFRKKKALAEKARKAETNRLVHGRTAKERARLESERTRAAEHLDGHRLEKPEKD